MRPRALLFLISSLVLVATRLAHSGILWADDTLPLAAALQVARGAALYRDVWFDKPPLVAWIHLLWGATDGWAMRLGGAAVTFAAAWLAYLAARARFDEIAARWSFGCIAFFLTFYLPSAVIPTASDFLLLVSHLAAIGFAWRGQAFAAGAAAGVGLLCSSKAVFVLGACALWRWRELPRLLMGFLAPQLLVVAWFGWHGSAADYYRQAWQWGRIYAADSFLANPAAEFLKRTANWAGFHAALMVGSAIALYRDRDRRDLVWIGLAVIGVVLGLRFFPRYYFLLLAPAALLAGRGVSLASGRLRLAILALALIPLLRFGPRYAMLCSDLLQGRSHEWSDLTLDQDSRAVASHLKNARGSLFVWGFRSEIFVLAPHLKPASRFLESQPISGVLADRHLFDTHVVAPEFVKPQLQELLRSRPDVVVDALGPLNPALSLERYPPLGDWMRGYERWAATRHSIVYRKLPAEPR